MTPTELAAYMKGFLRITDYMVHAILFIRPNTYGYGFSFPIVPKFFAFKKAKSELNHNKMDKDAPIAGTIVFNHSALVDIIELT